MPNDTTTSGREVFADVADAPPMEGTPAAPLSKAAAAAAAAAATTPDGAAEQARPVHPSRKLEGAGRVFLLLPAVEPRVGRAAA
jgi:hypothetical protein